MKLPDQGMQERIGGDHNLGASRAYPWNVAAELDRVAETLVGNQQQRGVLQCCSIPLRAVSWRQQCRRTRDPVAPLILAPALRKLASQQKRLCQLEVRAGSCGIEF